MEEPSMGEFIVYKSLFWIVFFCVVLFTDGTGVDYDIHDSIIERMIK